MKKRTVLYVVEDMDSAQFRYRVSNVKEALEKSDKWNLKWVLKDKLADEKLDGVDLVVILRQTGKDKTVLNFIKKAHGRGLRVLFDLDDLIFDYMDLPVLMRSTGSKNIFYWAGYVWGIRRIAKKVDGFITTNEFLGRLMKRSFNKPYAVVSNSLNSTQVKLADGLLSTKKHKEFIVGYFSGSPTHVKDFKMVEPEILKFLKKHENARFLMVGYMELSKEMQAMIKTEKVKILKLVDYKKLISLVAGVDVNIAPLLINEFTNSKSELKFFEAGVVETVTIASPTYSFKGAISDGKNGFLAQPGDWYDKLEYIYDNPKEVKEIAKNAREYSLNNYYGKKFLKEVEEGYEFFG